jgi:hypothetical protein
MLGSMFSLLFVTLVPTLVLVIMPFRLTGRIPRYLSYLVPVRRRVLVGDTRLTRETESPTGHGPTWSLSTGGHEPPPFMSK